jgi:predicted nuclease of predicted toxin-antitoxin system
MHILVEALANKPRLRNDGHDVLYVAEMSPGIDDEEVLGAANEHDALLPTADKDFGELVFRLGRVSRVFVKL